MDRGRTQTQTQTHKQPHMIERSLLSNIDGYEMLCRSSSFAARTRHPFSTAHECVEYPQRSHGKKAYTMCIYVRSVGSSKPHNLIARFRFERIRVTTQNLRCNRCTLHAGRIIRQIATAAGSFQPHYFAINEWLAFHVINAKCYLESNVPAPSTRAPRRSESWWVFPDLGRHRWRPDSAWAHAC